MREDEKRQLRTWLVEILMWVLRVYPASENNLGTSIPSSLAASFKPSKCLSTPKPSIA